MGSLGEVGNVLRLEAGLDVWPFGQPMMWGQTSATMPRGTSGLVNTATYKLGSLFRTSIKRQVG